MIIHSQLAFILVHLGFRLQLSDSCGMPIWNSWMRKKQITHICSGKPEGEEAACTGGFPQDQHDPGGLISPSLSQQDFMCIWCNSGNYRRLQLRSDPLLRSKPWSESGTLLALHWYLSAHMEINKAPISSCLSASYQPTALTCHYTRT